MKDNIDYKKELEKAIILLEEALYFTNMVPNKGYKVKSFKDSYELASNIENYLENIRK